MTKILLQGNTDWVVNVEYNDVHDFGAGITSDFGAIKTGSTTYCDNQDEAGLEQNCYTYIRLYNNILRSDSSRTYLAKVQNHLKRPGWTPKYCTRKLTSAKTI